MNLQKFKIFFLVIVTALFSYSCAESTGKEPTKENQVVKTENAENAEIAADGFDTVAYFATQKAIKGNKHTAIIYEGAKWYFSNEENKNTFLKNPEQYVPNFEEYCPYSLSQGKKIEGKPTHWRVIKNKLYFFYSENFAKKFEEDSENLLKKADQNWEKLEKEKKE